MEKKDLSQIHLCENCVYKSGLFGCGGMTKMRLESKQKLCGTTTSTEKRPPKDYSGKEMHYTRVIRCLEFKEKQHD